MKPTKSEFAFKALNVQAKNTNCPAPVAASVRKSASKWVQLRFNKSIMKATQFKAGSILTPFFDEKNRALLLLSDQRPTPANARKCYGKEGSTMVEFPRQLVLVEWFQVGPIRPLELIEASHGRLVVVVPK